MHVSSLLRLLHVTSNIRGTSETFATDSSSALLLAVYLLNVLVFLFFLGVCVSVLILGGHNTIIRLI